MANLQVNHRESRDRSSSDVLFPEDDPRGINADQTCYSEESFYSAPSTVYSGYSQDAKYLFEPELYAQPHTLHQRHPPQNQSHHHYQQQQQQQPCNNNSYNKHRGHNNNNYSEINLISKHSSPRFRQDHQNQHPHHQQQQHNNSSRTVHPGNNSNRDAEYGFGEEAQTLSGRVLGNRAFGEALRTSYGKFSSRRRTWSPPTCARVMAAVENIGVLRTCQSNEQLDNDEDGTSNYIGDKAAPPRLAPISGVPSKNSESTLIRPIAFKPVVPSHQSRYLSTPHLASHSRISPPQPKRHDMRSRNHSQDDGYVSQDYSSGIHSHSTSNVSQGSLLMEANANANTAHSDKPGPYLVHPDSHHGHAGVNFGRPESHASSNLSRVSSGHPDGYIQTPSPSDSGVGDMEALLREKDAEIQQLRETMAHNEMAILKVSEEKQQNWEVEMKNLHQQWERRLQGQQQKGFKTEQALLIQLFKIQQERKNLRLDVEQLQKDKDTMEEHYKRTDEELKSASSKLEELQWDLCQKSGEISLLKSQLKDSMDSTSNKSNEMVSLRTQIKELQKEISDKDAAIKQLHTDLDKYDKDLHTTREELLSVRKDCLRAEEKKSRSTENLQNDSGLEFGESSDTESLKQELTRVQQELQQNKARFDEERLQWLEEKNKVIRYQKHLQLNYVQMFRKNRQLEAEIEQLTLELENRDLNLMGESRVEESAC